jgi:SAM-dependent methyltransferase
MIPSTSFISDPYVRRYRDNDECRATIFRDMILDDASTRGSDLTFLDTGCGRGFDGDRGLQRELAKSAGQYIGTEPDPDIELGDYFTQVHRTALEDAPIERGSIDIAFAIMVLEHLSDPQPFWDGLWDALAPGGVFWGLTVDGRHPFCLGSLWMQRLGLKALYLNGVLGERGMDHYENYPVFYRCNTPAQIEGFARRFTSCDFVNFARVGQLNPYYPKAFHGLASAVDRRLIRHIKVGTLLAVRAEK